MNRPTKYVVKQIVDCERWKSGDVVYITEISPPQTVLTHMLKAGVKVRVCVTAQSSVDSEPFEHALRSESQ